SSRRRHTRSDRDWSSDVCSSDLSTQQPPVTPDAFFKEKVAPQFYRRIDDLRRQILSLEQQVLERLAAQATVRVVIEGEGGGTWRSEERRVGKECGVRWAEAAWQG